MRAVVLATLITCASGVAAERFIEGIEHSPVRVLIYEDLQCPDCADFRRMLDERLLPNYATRVTFEHRDFPLAKHAWARKAAIAARFFDEAAPRAGVAFRRYCFEHQPEINAANFHDKLAGFAKEHKVEPEKALAALDDARLGALVETDFQDGVARGVAHTPTALVNGQPFVEHFTYEEIAKTIDAELAGAK